MRMHAKQKYNNNIWPGFVDALATLILVVIFLLMFFVVGQHYLKEELTTKNDALERLSQQINSLIEQLALEKKESESLFKEAQNLKSELSVSQRSLDRKDTQIGALQKDISTLQDLKKDLETQIAQLLNLKNDLTNSKDTLEKQVSSLSNDLKIQRDKSLSLEENVRIVEQEKQEVERDLTEKARIISQQAEQYTAQIALLTEQIKRLREQLIFVAKALNVIVPKDNENNIDLTNLTAKLNIALAEKVEELSKYRSEFFGKLRDILGDRDDIKIVGDRFVFQSEVLFSSGSATLEKQGKNELIKFANAVKSISKDIPQNISWILRVDGHTDKQPISTAQFSSNWELSTARATAVVKFLVQQGIDPHYLAATGFGEFQPIDKQETAEAFKKNRRIEFKITGR